jgi:hypothetical protein
LRPATAQEPCPRCRSHDGCKRGEDGLILCRKETGQAEGFVFLGQSKADPQWAEYRLADDPQVQERERQRREDWERSRKGKAADNGHEPYRDMADKAQKFARNVTPERLTELAAALGIPEASLTAASPGLGYSACPLHEDITQPCWTFPEANAGGVTGILCRYAKGDKLRLKGSLCGLILPDHWAEGEGPLFLVEGPTDTAAMLALGLPAIGRPSNTGGVDCLVELLRDFPAERDLVVVGEHDSKPDGKWPGRDGAIGTAEKLAWTLHRHIAYVFPPAGWKDVRAWAAGQKLDVTIADAWHVAGERLLQAWQGKYQVVEPGIGSYRFLPLDSATFATRDYRATWLVKKLLVRGQPIILGGPRKSLKTSFLVDLAIALGTASPFLGEFFVPERVRVALLSGESGEFTVQETARRVARARGINLAAADVLWAFRLPQLSQPEDLSELKAGLENYQVEVALIDPLYLCLLAGDAAKGLDPANLFHMGPLFVRVAQHCLDVGCTPLLAHHARKNRAQPFEPMELEDLSYSGVQEFARQWILLGRRERYEPGSGLHNLWLEVGGSVGFGGLWGVDVDEGKLDEEFGGRKWEVVVRAAADVRQEVAAVGDTDKVRQQASKDRADDDAVMSALDRLQQGDQPTTYHRVWKESRLSEARMQRAVTRLRAAGLIEETTVVAALGKGGKRPVRGLRRKGEDDHSHHSPENDPANRE